ncbi:MAG: caspase family protein [Oligoflexia bacterium]|nr:caspase family protein [Oligoflexia bacterium]
MKIKIMGLIIFVLWTGNVIAASASGDRRIRRLAFVVGRNDGGPARVRLKYANSDAKTIADVLNEYGGVSSEDTFLLIEPDKSVFLKTLGMLRKRISGITNKHVRSELFFYYSGHADNEGLLLGGDKIPYSSLKNLVKKSFSDVSVLILDSCASGTITRIKGGKNIPRFYLISHQGSMATQS